MGDAVLFYGYDADLRGRILQLDKNEAVSALLQKKYDAATMAVVLGDENLVRFRTASDATAASLDETVDAKRPRPVGDLRGRQSRQRQRLFIGRFA